MQRWRARRRIKEKENQAGASPRQARQTERATWNTCRQQRVPMSGETGEDSGRGDREKKGEKKTGDGDWAGELRLKMGQKIRIFGSLEREKQREETQERKHLRH